MKLPPGYERDSMLNTVYRVKKALYELKQWPRAWFRRFPRVMIMMDYKPSHGDHTPLIKHSNSGEATIILEYVDDIIVT